MHTDAHTEENIRGSRAVIKKRTLEEFDGCLPRGFGGGKVEENTMAATTKENHIRVL